MAEYLLSCNEKITSRQCFTAMLSAILRCFKYRNNESENRLFSEMIFIGGSSGAAAITGRW